MTTAETLRQATYKIYREALMGKKESNMRPPNATKPVYGVGQMEGREGVALKDLQPPGQRDDGGKLSWHLIPVPALVEFCKVWHAGGQKYGAENWRGGLKFTRVYRPMMSHLNKWLCGKGSYDKELGTHHLMMVAWGCFVLYMYEIVFGREDLDDRPDKGLLNDEDFEYDNILEVVMGHKAAEEERLRFQEQQRNRDGKVFKDGDNVKQEDSDIEGLKHKKMTKHIWDGRKWSKPVDDVKQDEDD